MDDLEIIDKYHGLTRIEDQFRKMKGTLNTRPIYVNTPALFSDFSTSLVYIIMQLRPIALCYICVSAPCCWQTREDISQG